MDLVVLDLSWVLSWVSSFQKIFGLYGLNHHVVKQKLDVTNTWRQDKLVKMLVSGLIVVQYSTSKTDVAPSVL